METNVSRGHMKMRLLAAAVAVLGFTGCNMSKQSAPDLTGPSTLGRSVTLAAAPDRILYDGSSQTTITATVRKADGSIDAGVGLRWEAAVVQVVSGNQTTTVVPVEPFPQTSVTGTNGTATTVVKAPVAPDVMPSGLMFLQIYAVPVGDDAQTLAPGVDAKPRMIQVELVPVTGAGAPNRLPVADFTMTPPASNIGQTVTFDASLSRDEGEICGDRCSYAWEFRYGAPLNLITKSGRIVTQSFPTPGVVNVKLYVTDERSGTGTKETTISINGPTAPVATIVVTPTSPKHNVSAVLDGTSPVGAGATIVSWAWDFGGGVTASGRVITHTFVLADPLVSQAFPVTLTVTDDLGRTSTKVLAVTVVP